MKRQGTVETQNRAYLEGLVPPVSRAAGSKLLISAVTRAGPPCVLRNATQTRSAAIPDSPRKRLGEDPPFGAEKNGLSGRNGQGGVWRGASSCVPACTGGLCGLPITGGRLQSRTTRICSGQSEVASAMHVVTRSTMRVSICVEVDFFVWCTVGCHP
jgi:hypothetical protein